MKDLAYKPVPFALGATAAPGLVGFLSRVLADPRVLNVPPLATRGVFFAGTTVGALMTGQPFLWGAFIGQLSPTMDMLAEAAANAVLGGRAPAALPAPAVSGLRLSSAERYAEGAAAGQVSEQDIAEMQRLRAEMSDSWSDINQMAGISDQRRVGFSTGDIASSRRPTRF